MKKDIMSPEGLTPAQEKLAGMLYDTKTIAKVGRLIQNSDGTKKPVKIERPTSPIDFAQEGEFALKLHDTHPEAPLSPIYINLRKLPDNVNDQVGKVLSEVPAPLAEVATGIPDAADPIAKAYGKHANIPIVEGVLVKDKVARKIVSGTPDFSHGKVLRLVDDLATHGESKIESAKVVEEMGYKVQDILVLVDRQQGAIQELREAGYKIHFAMTITQLLRFGLRTKRITNDQFHEVINYLGVPT